MGNTNSANQLENLELKIFDRFILLNNNMAKITGFDVYMMTLADVAKSANAIEKCKHDISKAKQTFASKQNILTIEEEYFVPIIYNLNYLNLTDCFRHMAKHRTKCIKLCREIANFLRKYTILTQKMENVN